MPTYLKKNQVDNPNLEKQYYKNIELKLMGLGQITNKAARFRLFNTNQNIWIPTKHLDETFTIKEGENLDYIFNSKDVVNKLAIIIHQLRK